MLGQTISLTFNGVAKVMTLIQEGNFASEYLLKEATEEFRVKIRHSKETQKVGQQGFDRHYAEFTHFVYPTAALPLGITSQVYFIVRSNPNSDGSDAKFTAFALSALMNSATLLPKIINWES